MNVVPPLIFFSCGIAFPTEDPNMLPDLKEKLDRLGERLDSLGRHL